MARKGWDDLAPSSRSRLEGAGRSGKLAGVSLTPAQTRAYYEGGGDLRAGYGKARPPRGAAPVEETSRIALGLSTSTDNRALERWRRTNSPDWIPRNNAAMGTDTAAILSQIDVPPAKWKEATFEVLTDGRVKMTIQPIRGNPRIVFLPDRDSMSEVTRLIRNPTAQAGSKADKKRLEKQWRDVRMRVNATGTDQAVPSRGPLPAPGLPPRPSTPTSSGSSRRPSNNSTSSPPPGRKAQPTRSSSIRPSKPTKSTAGAKKATPRKRTAGRRSAPGPSPIEAVAALLDEVQGLTVDEIELLERLRERLQ